MEASNECAGKSEAPALDEVEIDEWLKIFDKELSFDEELGNPILVEENVSAATKDIATLLEENYKNKIGLLTKENYKQLPRPFIVVIHAFKEHAGELQKWLDLLAELSSVYSNIQFFIADPDACRLFYSEYEYDYDGTSTPYIFAVDNMERQFRYSECVPKLNFTASESIKEFCEDLLKCRLFTSEPVPVDTSSNNAVLKTAVGYNFQELVDDARKDVLLIIYSDFCFFSKELLPILDELAFILSDDAENLSIVKINDELNYIPLKYCTYKYPSVMYIRQYNKKNLVRYRHGPRTIENLIKFIAQNSTFELIKFDRYGNKNYNLNI